jgi:peroxiredoxin
MPVFNELAATRDDVTVLAINYLDASELVRGFVDEMGLDFPIGLDPAGRLNAAYQVRFYPRTFIIDPAGVITAIPMFEETPALADLEALLEG